MNSGFSHSENDDSKMQSFIEFRKDKFWKLCKV